MLDFKNKKITVMGLGLHGGGVGVAKFLVNAGAKVTVTDLRSSEELKESIDALKGLPIKFILGQHRSEDFSRADMIIKNPGVPNNSRSLQIAKENKVPIETDVGIFFEFSPAPIIGITGTRGKSTTSVLIFSILKACKKDVVLAGNIRISVLGELPKVKKQGLAVLELSSWQLEGLEKHQTSPHVALVTNIMRDHMNRYKTEDDYINAKKNIFKFQNKNDNLVLNYDDEVVRSFSKESKAKVYFYSAKWSEENREQFGKEGEIGAWVKDEEIVFGESQEKILNIKGIKLKGEHNIYNVLAAVTIAKINNAPNKIIQKVVSEFTGLPGRLQLIKEITGVKYINDTTSTIPDATIVALKTFSDKDIILIAGGTDKNSNYQELADFVTKSNKIKKIVLLPGTATDKILKELNVRDYGVRRDGGQVKVTEVGSMEEAVNAAHSVSEDGDIVLLSPGAASFGLFKNEFDRGDRFDKCVFGVN